MMRVGIGKIWALAGLMAVAACAPPPPPPPPPPPVRIIVAPPPPPMMMPTPPNSASPTLTIPPVDALGRRMTANVDLSPEQALWQLRIGLNVAALSCRGPDEAVLVANYTRFLNSNQRAIAAAERWVIREQGVRNGTNGIAARDALSTRLYNYFAQPPVKPGFCLRATQIMAAAALEPTANILAFSTTQLPALDQPFVEFYANYARYQADYAVWRAMQPAPAIAPAVVFAPGVPGAPASPVTPVPLPPSLVVPTPVVPQPVTPAPVTPSPR